jgi:predicted homoserine dehydrogenase-like protein
LGISIASVVLRNEPTGSSRYFLADVAACAKKNLAIGDLLDGEGGFTVYGVLLSASESLAKHALPLGLSGRARVKRPVSRGEILSYSDVELEAGTLAFELRSEMEGWKACAVGAR